MIIYLTTANGSFDYRLQPSDLIRSDDAFGARIGAIVPCRVERLCEHGVGHPIGVTPLERTISGLRALREPTAWADHMSVHGCDGCCEQFTELTK